jgi:hypothetical protein
MTPGNMRQSACSGWWLIASTHPVVSDVSKYPDDIEVPSFGRRSCALSAAPAAIRSTGGRGTSEPSRAEPWN